MNFVKSKLCYPSQAFVGKVTDHHGFVPTERNIETVAGLTPPKMAAKLRAFLGMAGYLLKFVEGYSFITAPLTDTLKNRAFQWTRTRQLHMH